jgi:hypothetical protein
MTILDTSGKCMAIEPASALLCSLSVLAAFFLLFFVIFIFLQMRKSPSRKRGFL